jgi:hypothetical protein
LSPARVPSGAPRSSSLPDTVLPVSVLPAKAAVQEHDFLAGDVVEKPEAPQPQTVVPIAMPGVGELPDGVSAAVAIGIGGEDS